jgi:hypothetical protein
MYRFRVLCGSADDRDTYVPLETREEAGRIAASRSHHGGIVEREVPPARAPLAQALRQRALARLSRTREKYGRRVIERRA